ncbi:MAG: amidohydrolase family protein [Gammaproteobacteria bacterium]
MNRSIPHMIALLLIMLTHGMAIAVEPDVAQVFVDVNIVRPELNRVDRGQSVLIRDGRVAAVGAIAIPDGATVIDGNGRYLSPGLVEMHAHVPEARRGRQYLEDVLYLWVANGITTVRNMAGEAAHLELREEIARGDVLGPRLYTSGPRFAGKRIEDAPARVVAQKEAGYDFLKVHMGLTAPIYDEISRSAAENDMIVAGHVAEGVGLWRALEAQQKSIDHLDAYFKAMVADDTDLTGVKDQLLGFAYLPFIDPEKFATVSEATAAAGVWNVPTLTLAVNFVGPFDAADYPELQYMPPKVAGSWEKIVVGYQATLEDPAEAQQFLRSRDRLVMALHEAGAGLLLGSDTPQMLNVPGFALHKELALMIAAGLTPAEALTTGTVNPAIYFDAEDTFGRIAEGLSADLVLTDANPLEQPETLRQPAGVMVRGGWLSRDELRAGLDAIAERNRAD